MCLGGNKPSLFSTSLLSLKPNNGVTKAQEEGAWCSLALHSSDQRVGWSQGAKKICWPTRLLAQLGCCPVFPCSSGSFPQTWLIKYFLAWLAPISHLRSSTLPKFFLLCDLTWIPQCFGSSIIKESSSCYIIVSSWVSERPYWTLCWSNNLRRALM